LQESAKANAKILNRDFQSCFAAMHLDFGSSALSPYAQDETMRSWFLCDGTEAGVVRFPVK
jgi:hypothetical protein